MQYAGMVMQFFVSIGLAVWLGRLADVRLSKEKTPILTWILPLLVIVGLIIKIFIDTGKRNNNKT
jgi:membrane protein DedA with SNARE-associated domain